MQVKLTTPIVISNEIKVAILRDILDDVDIYLAMVGTERDVINFPWRASGDFVTRIFDTAINMLNSGDENDG